MMTDETKPQPEEDQPVETTAGSESDTQEIRAVAVEADVAAPASSDSGSGRKIQIGSRRNKQETDKPQGAKPHVGGKVPSIPVAVPKKGPVPVPSVRDQLSQDLEDEIAAALGGQSIDDLMEQSTPSKAAQVETDDRRRASVL